MPSRKEVKAAAFLPEAPPRNLETSIQQIKGMSESTIWEVGRDVGNVSKRKLRARADITVGEITNVGLKVSPDPPPNTHAVIIGWPGYESGKSAQMIMANKLALAATLHLPEDGLDKLPG